MHVYNYVCSYKAGRGAAPCNVLRFIRTQMFVRYRAVIDAVIGLCNGFSFKHTHDTTANYGGIKSLFSIMCQWRVALYTVVARAIGSSNYADAAGTAASRAEVIKTVIMLILILFSVRITYVIDQ